MGKKYQEIRKRLTIQYNCVSISTYVQPIRVASKSRNGYVHLMNLLIASFGTLVLTCQGADHLLENAVTNSYLSKEAQEELTEVIKANTEPGCWDAND